MATATITSKGQVTIPRAVRERLGLKTGDRVDFVLAADGSVTLKSKRMPFERLRGILRNPEQRRVSVQDMDRAIEISIRRSWARTGRSARK